MITQRERDEAAGYILADWMTEDPEKDGIPLFLQYQNRRPADPEALAQVRQYQVDNGVLIGRSRPSDVTPMRARSAARVRSTKPLARVRSVRSLARVRSTRAT